MTSIKGGNDYEKHNMKPLKDILKIHERKNDFHSNHNLFATSFVKKNRPIFNEHE